MEHGSACSTIRTIGPVTAIEDSALGAVVSTLAATHPQVAGADLTRAGAHGPRSWFRVSPPPTPGTVILPSDLALGGRL